MNQERVKNLLNLALIFASQEDFGNRELGVIHLLKLLYLADVAYAERHNGEIYTGIDWRFYHFGPWSVSAYQAAIEHVVGTLSLSERLVRSNKGLESKRFHLPSGHPLAGKQDEIGRSVPIEVFYEIKRSVHDYGSDTPNLLKHVYKTIPMLYAKPEEKIDFSHAAAPPLLLEEGDIHKTQPVELSKTKIKKKEQRRAELKQQIQEKTRARIEKRKAELVLSPVDQDFFSILTLLDQEEIQDPIHTQGQLEFDSSIWDGSFRRECGIP